jgi:formylglycine-generating enzyme required for sulfatase activity
LHYLRESKKPRRFYDFAANAWTTVSRQEEAQGEQSDSSSNKAGDAFTVPDLSLEMLWVEPGTFDMGSPTSESNRSSWETQHQVTLTAGFWLGKHEVTQSQWEKVMGGNPSEFKKANWPVEKVSWADVMLFCEKLTELERKAGRLPAGMSYQLPTEAQWEYACRAGTKTAYAFGAELTYAQANIFSRGEPTVVGKYAANAWGFHDMHGNVWEWCMDWEGFYPTDAVSDPTGPTSGFVRVFRGGSWYNPAYHARSAYRNRGGPAYGYDNLGFRLSLRPAASK